jgi:excinuclease UvrABC ATPase subunit
MAASNWKCLGRNDEVTTCECCGKTNLKFTVVLTDGEGEVRYGRDCAARKLLGNNKSGSVKSIDSLATAIAYAKTWLKKTDKHTADVVANAIRVRFCHAWSRGQYEIEFYNGVKVVA